MTTILIADDNTNLLEMLSDQLSTHDYEVFAVANGQAAVQASQQNQIDLAILDIMMPDLDGFETCRQIKQQTIIPIIMLTAKGNIFDKQQGFEAGCDDYLTKPFDIRELIFRMTALLRRYQTHSPAKLQVGHLTIDQRNMMVSLAGSDIFLPLKEFQVLLLFCQHPNQVFTRENLIDSIWGADFTGNDRTVDVHVKRLRTHLGNQSGVQIETVRGVGYRLEVAS